MIVSPFAILYAQPPGNKNKKGPTLKQLTGNNQAIRTDPDTLKKVLEDFRKFNLNFDSTAFEYTVLINDNAGLFAARQRGEAKNGFFKYANYLGYVINNAGLPGEELAKINIEIGQSAFAQGRYDFAAKRLFEAKSRLENSSHTGDNSYVDALGKLGMVYTTMGRVKFADSFLVWALSLRKSRFGINDRGLVPILNNKAVLDFMLGRYTRSEASFESAVSILQKNGLLSTMAYAIVLNNEAMLFQSLGRYEEAKDKLDQAIEIGKKLKATRARIHLKFFTNLALLYQRMNQFEDAERTYHVIEDKYEKGTTEYANYINNLAILRFLRGKDEFVEGMLKNAARIFMTNLGENSTAYAKVINDLGIFYRLKAQYDSAAFYLERSLQIRKRFLGVKHPVYVQNEEDLAILYWKKKDWAKASPLYTAVMNKTIDFVNTYFVAMSEAEKARYWDILSPRFLRAFNFLVEASAYNDDAAAEIFRFRVATKGVLLSSAQKITESILTSGDKQLILDYSDWIDLKEQLASFYAYSNEDLKEQNINLDSLEAVANGLEKKLSANSVEFSHFNFIKKLTVWDIRSGLKPNEALLEIIRLRYYDQQFTDSCRYIGLIITKNNQKPKLIVLPNGPELENTAAKLYQRSIKNKIPDEKSFQNFWTPFEPELKDKKRIFISPDGVYNQVNLNTLKRSDGDYLIRQNELVLVGNPRDILPDSVLMSRKGSKNATLFGNPDFGSAKIPGLPATSLEVDSIDRVLKSSGYRVSEYLQKEATETNLKQAKKVGILHIATHGYFMQDVVKTFWPMGVAEENAKNNVLLRSGLLLAGADDADRSKSGLDSSNNGVMTSYEAMNLDLRGTRLVVLSACETGLGEIKAGEGVYGLQRAFLEAGAEALIMSLWKVDDAATQQLMNYFYNNWTQTGNKQKAFRQAQLQLMEKYPAPYYWGAFVMLGN
ncbi:MAG TPA: CHAT domain-containing tetratricopeptide repeat protein [Chitinophagaceae bacterium]|nr:CHAT domain-containing tetratricopeptide repeat protein [Chitinophagaceae bacterium]